MSEPRTVGQVLETLCLMVRLRTMPQARSLPQRVHEDGNFLIPNFVSMICSSCSRPYREGHLICLNGLGLLLQYYRMRATGSWPIHQAICTVLNIHFGDSYEPNDYSKIRSPTSEVHVLRKIYEHHLQRLSRQQVDKHITSIRVRRHTYVYSIGASSDWLS